MLLLSGLLNRKQVRTDPPGSPVDGSRDLVSIMVAFGVVVGLLDAYQLAGIYLRPCSSSWTFVDELLVGGALVWQCQLIWYFSACPSDKSGRGVFTFPWPYVGAMGISVYNALYKQENWLRLDWLINIFLFFFVWQFMVGAVCAFSLIVNTKQQAPSIKMALDVSV